MRIGRASFVVFSVLAVGTGCGSNGGDAGSGSSDGSPGEAARVVVACYNPDQFICKSVTPPPGARYVQIYTDLCRRNDAGAVSTMCPAPGLIGCCTVSPVMKECYYIGYNKSADKSQTDCVAAGGTWSTTS